MEPPPMVCYSTGAINSLFVKITRLMENHGNIKNLLKDITGLREDLNRFTGGRGMGEQVKVWMKQAREMIYDIEDWIDLEKQEVASFSESAKQIDQFKGQIKKARKRCKRYELLKQAPTSQIPYAGAEHSEVSGRRLFLEEKTVLVGMDGPKSELLKHLKNEQKELKVVSVHGTGGHGKTALAMLIYGDIFVKDFECQAFVSVGRTTSTRTALIEILCQVKKSEVDAWQSRSYSKIISELWGFLRTKRYFICIDDIRNTGDLHAIVCALPDNNFGSRILTTTRLKDVALSCSSRPSDVIYEMITLDEADSEILFRNSIYVQKGEEWPDHFNESSKKVLQLCGGVPMAILIAAGLFGRIYAELSVKSGNLNKTTLCESNQSYSAIQAMSILDISYGDLPLPLKSCFLYLAAFSRNNVINKDRLIRRWVTEGLIPGPGNSSWETGERYFDELISRRLVEPAFDDSNDQPIGCSVHGVVFDFMEHLSTEENFVSAGAVLMSGVFPRDRVRRVSLDYGDEDDECDTYCRLEDKSNASSSDEDDEAISFHLSWVRTLAFSGDASRIPHLSDFKHVRVLDLEDTKGLEKKQLESIGRLSLLRYLGLGSTDVTQLPPGIMALELLTTLDLRRTNVRHLPELRDKKLVSLLGEQLILARGIGGMQNLEELSKVVVGPNGSPADDMAQLVRESGRLRMLGVRFSHLHGHNGNNDRQGVRQFLEEVGKSNLQSLLLDNYPHLLLDLLLPVDSWAHKLRKLELRIGLDADAPVPLQEMASLTALTHLHISVEAVEAHTIRALGKLPKLVVLKLESKTSPCLTVSSEDGFPCLKVLWYNSEYGRGMGLRFDVGAMPQLRRLRLDLDARETGMTTNDDDFDLGIQQLPCLVKVHATIDWTNTTLTASQVEAAETHIREQVGRNTNRPVLELNRSRPVANGAEELVITIDSLDKWISNQIDPKKLVVTIFTKAWCPASRKMVPVFSNLANNFRDVVFLKVDAQEMDNIAKEFGVDSIPTFLFMKGGYVVDTVVGGGADEEEELKEKLEEQLSML
uniref:Thioredoxin domain-containing protein n=1 Tax=Oryza glumipatula TaxID=40148 RepID=A0A0E0AS90_9ORYZ